MLARIQLRMVGLFVCIGRRYTPSTPKYLFEKVYISTPPTASGSLTHDLSYPSRGQGLLVCGVQIYECNHS